MAKKEVRNKRENNKNKKSFFKDFKAELKKVNWLTPKQLLNNTMAVIAIVFITATIVFVLDLAFETINKNGIDKIKGIVGTNDSTSQNAATDATADEATTENTENQESTEETTQENTEASNEENNTENNAE